MNLLAFDTSTEILHVAVQCGAAASHAPLEHTAPGGAQASATLIPAIHALLAARVFTGDGAIEDDFQFGLDRILDGIDVLVRARGARR